MKKKIKVKISNDLGEENIFEVLGDIEESNKVITYYEENIFVRVKIDNKIIIQRKHPDYYLELIFEKDQKNYTLYEIYNPKTTMDVQVDTASLEIKNIDFKAKYKLKLNDEDVGVFTIDFKVED